MLMKEIINIFFFGDSICFGQGISLHQGWVAKISQKFELLSQKKNVEIVVTNAGVNGNTTRLGLERMYYDVLSHSCDIVTIQFGMNDCNYWKSDNGIPRVSKRAFEANLHEIIDRYLAFNIKNIFLNTNHPTACLREMSPAKVQYQSSNATYNEIIRKVANDRKEIKLNDIEHFFKEKIIKENLSIYDLVLPEPDLLHLSKIGHELYYKFISPKIEKAIMGILES